MNGSAMPLNQSILDQSGVADFRQSYPRPQMQESYSRQELLASPPQSEFNGQPASNRQQERPQSAPGNGLILNFGPNAAQDPIYKFKDNSIRTTK